MVPLDREQLELQTITAGEYEVIEQVGEGTYGMVYKARRLSDGSLVALKRLRANYMRNEKAKLRLAREYQILNELAHSSIARALALRLDGPIAYIVLEYVEGVSIGRLIKNTGYLGPEEVCDIAIQVCEALDVSHKRGVIHRDIKAENIIVTEKGPVITDFGLGLVLGAPRLTREGDLVGSIETMPPEQLLGLEIDPSADIYALGATLFHAATGYQYLPFTANVATNIRLVLDRWGVTLPHLLNPQIPEPLSNVIVKCLARDPASRFTGANELRAELEQVKRSKAVPEGATKARGLGAGIPRDRLDTISSGSLSLDLALGGGWPRGHIVELYGPEGCGKTTLAMHLIAQTQNAGGVAALLDADHAIDPYIAERCGVDIDSVYYLRPTDLEETMAIIEQLTRSRRADAIVVDSIAALLPRIRLREELRARQEDAIHQQIMRDGLRRVITHLDQSRAVLMFLNQLDLKVGVIYGSPETTPFGTGPLRYFASVRVDLRRVEALMLREVVLGYVARAKIKKNRFAPPFREAEFELLFTGSIVRESELLDLGKAAKLVEQQGDSYRYGETQMGERLNAIRFLEENPGVARELESRIWEYEPVSELTKRDKARDSGFTLVTQGGARQAVGDSASDQEVGEE